jgi:hypothetical protein
MKAKIGSYLLTFALGMLTMYLLMDRDPSFYTDCTELDCPTVDTTAIRTQIVYDTIKGEASLELPEPIIDTIPAQVVVEEDGTDTTIDSIPESYIYKYNKNYSDSLLNITIYTESYGELLRQEINYDVISPFKETVINTVTTIKEPPYSALYIGAEASGNSTSMRYSLTGGYKFKNNSVLTFRYEINTKSVGIGYQMPIYRFK